MKIEECENQVNLVPESDFERKVLQRLKGERIKNIRFEDDWDQKGKLQIEFNNKDAWGL